VPDPDTLWQMVGVAAVVAVVLLVLANIDR
jgi:hypothetical protein